MAAEEKINAALPSPPLGQCIGGKADFVLWKGDFER